MVILRAAGLYFLGSSSPIRTGSGLRGGAVYAAGGASAGLAALVDVGNDVCWWMGARYGRGRGSIGFFGKGIVVPRDCCCCGGFGGDGDGGGGGFAAVTLGTTGSEADGGCEDGVGFEGCEVVVAGALLSFSVPFAATSCNILLEEGAAGVVCAGLSSVFLVAVFGVLAVFDALFGAVDFATFFTTSSAASFTAFAVFVAFAAVFGAFEDAVFATVFATSSVVSSTTFLGRPRPRFGTDSSVDMMATQLA